MAKADINKKIAVTQGFIDKLLDKISNILREQHALKEVDEEQAEEIVSLLNKISSIERDFEQLTKSLAQGSYPLKLARSIRVAPTSVKPQIVPVAIAKSQLVSTYNEIPSLLSGYINPVSLTPDSYRGKNTTDIILETTIKGNYWAICTQDNKQYQYWLVPNSNIYFNVHKIKTVKNLFQLKGNYDAPNSDFILEEPAVLTLLPNNKYWKLIQPGILLFVKNLKAVSSQAQQPQNVVDEQRSKIKQPNLSNLRAFQETIDRLASKVTQLEIQSVISQKTYLREQKEWSSTKETLTQQIEQISTQQVLNKQAIGNFNTGKLCFLELYNRDKQSLLNEVVNTVDVTESSLNKKCLGDDSKLILENTNKRKYWIFKENNYYYLVPHAKININEHNKLIIELLFECINFSLDFTNFELIQPAKVSQLDSELWQLEKKGRIEFILGNKNQDDDVKNKSSQDSTIDFKTKVSLFRQDYTKDIKLISDRIVAKVAISVETLEQITFYKPNLIILENTVHGKYWIIDYLGSYFLIPNEISQITEAKETSLTVAKFLFHLSEYYPEYSDYHLIRPAIVTKISTNKWKLKEKGKFNFS